jgi:hypothetical protein
MKKSHHAAGMRSQANLAGLHRQQEEIDYSLTRRKCGTEMKKSHHAAGMMSQANLAGLHRQQEEIDYSLTRRKCGTEMKKSHHTAGMMSQANLAGRHHQQEEIDGGGGFHFLTVDVLPALLILIFLRNSEVIPK